MRSIAMRLVSAMALLLLAGAACAVPLVFVTDLSGPGEDPPNASPGTGTAEVAIDAAAHTLRVLVSFADLLSGTTASHIHCCVAPPGSAGVATTTPTFPFFPLGVTSGTYDRTFDTLDPGTYNAAFVTANGGTAASAEAALFAGISQGGAYLNIHTAQFPRGEIRGFLVAAAVPEPATAALLALALVLAAAARRPRQGQMTRCRRA
jgi:hypothetical protein